MSKNKPQTYEQTHSAYPQQTPKIQDNYKNYQTRENTVEEENTSSKSGLSRSGVNNTSSKKDSSLEKSSDRFFPFNWFENMNQLFANPFLNAAKLNASPVAALSQFNRNIEQMWEQFFKSFPMASGAGLFSSVLPQVDFNETEKSYTFTAELPELTEKDIDLRVQNGILNISSKKENSSDNTKGEKSKNQSDNVFALSNMFQAFESSFSLPVNADHDKIEASFEDGKLTITVPKLAQDALEKSRIAINAAKKKPAFA